MFLFFLFLCVCFFYAQCIQIARILLFGAFIRTHQIFCMNCSSLHCIRSCLQRLSNSKKNLGCAQNSTEGCFWIGHSLEPFPHTCRNCCLGILHPIHFFPLLLLMHCMIVACKLFRPSPPF